MTGEGKPTDFEGEKKRRLRGVIRLGCRKSPGRLECFVTADTVSSPDCL